jgi:hypothetical protein
MAAKNLTAQELCDLLFYDPETGKFTARISRGKRRAGTEVGLVNKFGYTYISIDGTKHPAHRLAWLYCNGEWPQGMLDHINCIKTDNRISNLRLATAAMNSQNQRFPRRGNRSGLLGVSWSEAHQGWRAKLLYLGRTLHLGMYDTPKEAHDVYVKVKRALHEGCTL